MKPKATLTNFETTPEQQLHPETLRHFAEKQQFQATVGESVDPQIRRRVKQKVKEITGEDVDQMLENFGPKEEHRSQ